MLLHPKRLGQKERWSCQVHSQHKSRTFHPRFDFFNSPITLGNYGSIISLPLESKGEGKNFIMTLGIRSNQSARSRKRSARSLNNVSVDGNFGRTFSPLVGDLSFKATISNKLIFLHVLFRSLRCPDSIYRCWSTRTRS